MTSFSPPTLPAVATRKSTTPRLDLGGKTAVLCLTPLGDVEVAEDLEDVDDGVPHDARQRLGVHHHAVNAEADAHLVGRRLEVNVGGPLLERVPDKFQGRLVALRFLNAFDARSESSTAPVALRLIKRMALPVAFVGFTSASALLPACLR